MLPLFFFSFCSLTAFRVFDCKTDLLIEIRWDELESFSAGLENNVVEFRNRCARAQCREHLSWSDQSHTNSQGDHFPIYCEEGYYYGKGVVINKVDLL